MAEQTSKADRVKLNRELAPKPQGGVLLDDTTPEPARLPEETAERVRLLTSAIYDILGCSGLIRIDYIITEGEKVNLLEINTTPGMTATSFIPQQVRAAGLDIKDVMTDIIENKF